MQQKTKDRLVYGAVWLACFAPLPWLAWRLLSGDLGANPIEALIRQLGVWGLRFILVGLAITPAARLLRRPRLIRFRRTVGLFAFAYVLLHWCTYVGVDQFFDWAAILKDIYKRPFITIGMTAFILLIPLAVSSTNATIRALGPVRWRRLHRLIYVIAPLGVLHYYMLVKADHRPPLIYAGLLAVLLGYRVFDWTRKNRSPP